MPGGSRPTSDAHTLQGVQTGDPTRRRTLFSGAMRDCAIMLRNAGRLQQYIDSAIPAAANSACYRAKRNGGDGPCIDDAALD